MIEVGFFRHLHIGHFGKGVHRFEDTLRCLSFGDKDPKDRWPPIRPFLEGINARCEEVLNCLLLL